MKRYCIFLSVILAFANNMEAQFPYAAANLSDGSIICQTTTTVITTMKNKVISKTMSEETFNTSLKIAFGQTVDDLDFNAMKEFPERRLPDIASGNNFARTLKETEDLATAQVPRFPAGLTYQKKTWGPHPCDNNNENIILLSTSFGTGHVADQRRGVTVGIEGIKGENKYYFVKVFAGGGWGEIMDVETKSKVFEPDPLDNYICKWIDYGGAVNMTSPRILDVFHGGTDMPESFSKKSPGYYTRFENNTYEESKVTTEYQLLKIDTAQIFQYIRKPAFKSFSLQGSFRQVVVNSNTQEIVETTEKCTVTLNFGKIKNEVILSTAKEEDYYEWLPVSQKATDYKVLKVKGELFSEDDVKKDTLHFYLSNVSRYPGKCTNFPKQNAGVSPDTSADMWFSKQQSDGNVVFVDSFHVKTRTNVQQAIVDIECNDFAARGDVSAKAILKNVNGYSKYDNKVTLKFPEDENENFIADKWEKDVGIFGKSLRPESDQDALPAGQEKVLGDGWTLFEEYRGLYSDKDILAKSANVQRKDKFVRTDPDYKDVYVFDDTNTLFETNFAPTNAARLNWHILADEHVIHYNTNAINSSLLTWGTMDISLVDQLDKYNHRWVNYNTPDKFRLKKHYCLFLMYSAVIDGTDKVGRGYTYGGNSNKTTPIDQTEIIVFQQKATLFAFLFGQCPAYLTPDEKKSIAENMYISTTIHEIGHGLGIPHHSKGIGKTDDGTNLQITLSMRNAIPDKESNLYKDYDSALCACGVRNCAMRYTFMYKEEFSTKELVTLLQTIFCKSSQKYVDSFGIEHGADGCFHSIVAK
jgi:hypothetical protein